MDSVIEVVMDIIPVEDIVELIPLMDSIISWFASLSLILQLTLIGLTLVGLEQFRQGHIGRVGTVTLVIILLSFAYPSWSSLETIWRVYTLVGGLIAIIAGTSYITKKSLPTGFYKFVFVFYGAIPIGLILIFDFPTF